MNLLQTTNRIELVVLENYNRFRATTGRNPAQNTLAKISENRPE